LHYICILPDGVSERDMLRTARVLLDGGSNIWLKGRAGNTVLAEAAQHGQLSIVKLLIQEYDRNIRLNKIKSSLKHYVNEANDYFENSIILAARSHPSVLEFLLQNYGDPNSSRRGFSILHIACSRFQLDKRDPDILSDYHQHRTAHHRWGTPLPPFTEDDDEEPEPERITNSERMKREAHQRILSLLLEYGADPRKEEPSTGMKPLHTAAFWGDIIAIESLIRIGGVQPNEELNMRNGWLPIHYACSEGQILAIQRLITLGASIWDCSDVPTSVEETEEELLPPVPRYPFLINTSGLPLGLHVPSPLDLLQFDLLKTRIRAFGRRA
jgi:ankyrin repeat protein